MEKTSRDEKLLFILKNTFGYDSFRFEQFNIIQSILDKRDTLAIMPTGGGKSLCYQIPALYLDGVTLVISPLISLMQDQVMNLEEYNINACFLNSSQTYEERKNVEAQIRSGETKIVYISPEGLLSGNMNELLRNLDISLVAIDEAHCVSQWGHEFRADYTKLGIIKEMFPETPVVALTATADEKTRLDICDQLKLKNPKIFVSSFDRPNIKYMIRERVDEMAQLDKFIKEYHPNDTGIVYCLSRKKVEKTAKALNELGHYAVAYHAGLSQEERYRNQELFNKKEKIIVVATIAFGMGIDRPDVRFVAHLDLPKSIEGYYQETGRAGRDGQSSTAWMIYGLQDVVKLSQMLESTQAGEHYKKVARHKLDSMLCLCETVECRRKNILAYFGQTGDEQCNYCDTCLDPAQTWDATIDAQKILSTIYRTGQVFGAGHIIDVLRGSKNAKIIQRGHEQLSVYGIGKEREKTHWNSILRQLLHMNYIFIKDWEYRSLALAQKSAEVLSGGKKLYLRQQTDAIPKKKIEKRSKEALAQHGKEDLFQSLREIRAKLATEYNVPPYIIFNDKTLHEMCLFLPQDKDQFLMINGVGASKEEKYGPIFRKKIAEFI